MRRSRHVDAVVTRERAHRGRGGHPGNVPRWPRIGNVFRGERQAHARLRDRSPVESAEIAEAREAHQRLAPAAERRTGVRPADRA
jgi:hypothetical protein